VLRALRARFPRPARARPSLQVQVLASLFFRNKAAYAVGKIVYGSEEVPFALPILQNARGELYLDALLLDADQLNVLFSFARAYFFVDMEVPAAYVSFLRRGSRPIGSRVSGSEFKVQSSELRSRVAEFRNPKPETRNPKPETRNSKLCRTRSHAFQIALRITSNTGRVIRPRSSNC
jgi:hypothetical protein